MTKRMAAIFITITAMALAGACGKGGGKSGGGAQGGKYADTPDGLKQFVEDMASATGDNAKKLGMSLQAPDAWFTSTFGDEQGKKFLDEYKPHADQLAELPGAIAQRKAGGQTEIHIAKIVTGDEPEATGAQSDAIHAMKTKVPLYAVRMIKPGEEAGWALWSFVYIDGGFKFVGKLM